MDNATAKEILSAYRANGEDARDPLFQEALEHCRKDPEMRQWLEEERQFDRQMVSALQQLSVPAEGLQSILATLPLDRKGATPKSTLSTFLPWGAGLIAVAAAVMIAMVLWVPDTSPRITPLQQASFSMPYLVGQSLPLDYHARDVGEIIQWLKRHDAPVPSEIPTALLSRAAVGCRIFADEYGHKISLLCFEYEGQPIHFFVFASGAERLLGELPLDFWWEEHEWNFYLTGKNDQTIGIASQISPDRLANLL